MNLISLLNRAFKEPGDTPTAPVATTSIANTCRSGARKKNCSEGRKEGRKDGRLKGERTIARAVDGGRLAGQNGRKSRYYRSHGGENTITPLPGRHNEFIAGNLRTINAELLTYCFASSWVASENGRRSRLFSISRREAAPRLSIVRKFAVEKREAKGRRRGTAKGLLPRCIILWRRPCAICTASFDRCRDLPYVSCVSCLRSSLTCPSYKLTREWLHARNAQVKNCFLLARSSHNLSSYKQHNPLGTRKNKYAD